MRDLAQVGRVSLFGYSAHAAVRSPSSYNSGSLRRKG